MDAKKERMFRVLIVVQYIFSYDTNMENAPRTIRIVLFITALAIVGTAVVVVFEKINKRLKSDNNVFPPPLQVTPVANFDTSRWSVYQNEILGFSLRYPPKWGSLVSAEANTYISQRVVVEPRLPVAPFFDIIQGFSLDDIAQWDSFILDLKKVKKDTDTFVHFNKEVWRSEKEYIDRAPEGAHCLNEDERHEFGESCGIVVIGSGKKAEIRYVKPPQLENIEKRYIFYHRGYRISISRQVTFNQYFLTEQEKQGLKNLLLMFRNRTADPALLKLFDEFDAVVRTIEFF